MQPPAELLSRILGKSRYFTLFYGEPADKPLTVELLHSLEHREYRRLDKRIRPERFPEAKPILVLNCNLRFPAALQPIGLADFLFKIEQPTFSHRTCYATSGMNEEVYRRLSRMLGRHAGRVFSLRSLGTCTFYPVRRGDRLLVAYFAI